MLVPGCTREQVANYEQKEDWWTLAQQSQQWMQGMQMEPPEQLDTHPAHQASQAVKLATKPFSD